MLAADGRLADGLAVGWTGSGGGQELRQGDPGTIAAKLFSFTELTLYYLYQYFDLWF